MKKFILLFIPILTFSFLFTTNNTYAQEYPQGETWMINENPVINFSKTYYINFESDGENYNFIEFLYTDDPFPMSALKYSFTSIYVDYTGGWSNEANRIITFEEAPTGDLLTWLQANAVKVLVLNDGYDEGYQDGYDEGYSEGLLEGDYQEGYQDGYDEGYQDGFIAGEKSKLAKNNESFYNNIAIWIPAVITVVALASIISIFGIKKKE